MFEKEVVCYGQMMMADSVGNVDGWNYDPVIGELQLLRMRHVD